MINITRRQMLGRSSLLAASLGARFPLPGASAQPGDAPRKLKIVAVGAHPDDPESACGGAMALYADAGHEVVFIYLTRGEAGVKGATAGQAAAIRTAEALKACAILNARPVFAGQIDGATEVNSARYGQIRKLLKAERPDIVFTHWSVDSHRDHRAAFNLVFDAWHEGGRAFDLYYFAADEGRQTQIFHPTDYVDIALSVDRKKAACFAHASQHPATNFWPIHEMSDRFHGMECGVKDAEGFIRECQNRELGVPMKQQPATTTLNA